MFSLSLSILLLFTGVNSIPQITIVNNSSYYVDIDELHTFVTRCVVDYTMSFDIYLSKPIIIYIQDIVKLPTGKVVRAYAEHNQTHYIIYTSTLNQHILAHELVHCFQYEKWNDLFSIANRYEWFIEGFADAVPIYLYRSTPVINHRLMTWKGFLYNTSGEDSYMFRQLFLALFHKYGFKNICQKYFRIRFFDVNPFYKLIDRRELSSFLLYYYDMFTPVNITIQQYRYPIKPTGSITIYYEKFNPLYILHLNISNVEIKYIDKGNPQYLYHTIAWNGEKGYAYILLGNNHITIINLDTETSIWLYYSDKINENTDKLTIVNPHLFQQLYTSNIFHKIDTTTNTSQILSDRIENISQQLIILQTYVIKLNQTLNKYQDLQEKYEILQSKYNQLQSNVTELYNQQQIIRQKYQKQLEDMQKQYQDLRQYVDYMFILLIIVTCITVGYLLIRSIL